MVLQRVANPFLVHSRQRFESSTLRHMVAVTKLVDVPDCDSGVAGRVGSSPICHPIIGLLENH